MIVFIIFGTRSINSTQQHGSFVCPRCSMQRDYRHVAVKNWFTLYFIPVIPMGKAGEFLECTACGGTFGMEALNYDPEKARRATAEQIRRLVVLAMVRASRTDDKNVAALCDGLGNMLGDSPFEEEVRQDIALARSAQIDLGPFFQDQTEDFTNEGKVRLFHLCAESLSSEHAWGTLDRQVLNEIGAAMGIPEESVERILQEI